MRMRLQLQLRGNLTSRALEPFDSKSAAFSDMVRAQLVQYAAYRKRIREHPSHLPQASVMIDRVEFPRVQECVPVCHVDNKIVILRAWVGELREEPTRVQIVVIFVYLPDRLTDLQMCLKVIHPMSLRAV